MSLRERVYSILIVSATDNFTSAFADLLSETRYSLIQTAASVNAAERILAEKSFDFVIINAPLPDDIGTRFAIDTCTSKQSAVLLLVKSDIHAGIHAVKADIKANHDTCSQLDGKLQRTTETIRKENLVYKRKNGRDPSCQQSEMDFDQQSKNERARCSPLYRETSNGSMHYKTNNC